MERRDRPALQVLLVKPVSLPTRLYSPELAPTPTLPRFAREGVNARTGSTVSASNPPGANYTSRVNAVQPIFWTMTIVVYSCLWQRKA